MTEDVLDLTNLEKAIKTLEIDINFAKEGIIDEDNKDIPDESRMLFLKKPIIQDFEILFEITWKFMQR